MGWACSRQGEVERRGVYGVLVGKTEGKRPLGRSRRRLEEEDDYDNNNNNNNNNNMDLQAV